ncbi:MAG TPA: cofactor-independent phosphoglycerate mutase [bacterium]|nr:cofactor-independent phosphoglycerate mutase [bacterium]
MKYVIIQGDGMGDRRGAEPGAKTPLEAARTPHFDRVAGCGSFGLIHTIPTGYPPGSDVGNLSLFGYDPRVYYTGRSPLEAAAMGVKLGPEDVSFRMNLVTMSGTDAEPVMADYSAGHIPSEDAARIVADLNDRLADESFQFYPGVSYRHLLVWRKGCQEMQTTPPHDITDQPALPHLPTGEGAEQLRRIMDASRALLTDHPVNRERRAAGKAPVSQVWLWGQGRAPSMPSFVSLHGLRGACISAVDLVRGVAVYAGFDIIHVPGATGYIDTDYAAKGEYALKVLADHDLVFVHIEAPDESGHMGSREEKIRAIESIDALIVGPLLDQLPALGPFRLCIVSDHATPVSLRTHTPDPVPFAMVASEQLASTPRAVKYGEADATASGVTIADGHTVIERLLSFPG